MKMCYKVTLYNPAEWRPLEKKTFKKRKTAKNFGEKRKYEEEIAYRIKKVKC